MIQFSNPTGQRKQYSCVLGTHVWYMWTEKTRASWSRIDPGFKPGRSGSNICALSHTLCCSTRRMLSILVHGSLAPPRSAERPESWPPTTNWPPSPFPTARVERLEISLWASRYHLHRLGHYRCTLQTRPSSWGSGGAHSRNPLRPTSQWMPQPFIDASLPS